ncbi:LOW QUALITY PROTEIN: hypothetical protein PHMEG_0006016 [Phytophthora megakarya]|uniref:Peptidase A2 domain-containing protein n=1 Tax=Phytophthora megakarya TaxID=4795 RepID=A0A225WRK5_9STRA|nr:LOW QUALITY PROTEIN: hypothetical protein PHMEG_0006016 [Phytophthora megakarya]
MHDAEKWEAFNELASLLRSNVDKNDLTLMLQNVAYGNRKFGIVNTTEIGYEKDGNLSEKRKEGSEVVERDGYVTQASASSVDPCGTHPRNLFRHRNRCQMRDKGGDRPNDARKKILLDTGANASVISAAYAMRLRLREVPNHNHSSEVRDINPRVLETRRQAPVKITLRWERVYEFEMRIMDHSAGVDVVLETDFMIPAGVRLDLFHGTAQLPDEVVVPMVKSVGTAYERPHREHAIDGQTEYLCVSRGEWRELRLSRDHLARRMNCGLKGPDNYVSNTPQWVLWVPRGELPREVGYVRLNSNKYNE